MSRNMTIVFFALITLFSGIGIAVRQWEKQVNSEIGQRPLPQLDPVPTAATSTTTSNSKILYFPPGEEFKNFADAEKAAKQEKFRIVAPKLLKVGQGTKSMFKVEVENTSSTSAPSKVVFSTVSQGGIGLQVTPMEVTTPSSAVLQVTVPSYLPMPHYDVAVIGTSGSSTVSHIVRISFQN